MRVLIYKRTHKNDPNEKGIFGIRDCMGNIRNWGYDAVIGIGGKSAWRNDTDIRYKINWIGLGPRRIGSPNRRADMVVFAHFELYEGNGLNIKDHYPNLYDYMYVDGNKKRFDMSSNLPESVFEEVKKIIDLVKDSPASELYNIESESDLEIGTDNTPSKCNGCF